MDDGVALIECATLLTRKTRTRTKKLLLLLGSDNGTAGPLGFYRERKWQYLWGNDGRLLELARAAAESTEQSDEDVDVSRSKSWLRKVCSFKADEQSSSKMAQRYFTVTSRKSRGPVAKTPASATRP